MPAYTPYALRQNDPAEIERARAAVAAAKRPPAPALTAPPAVLPEVAVKAAALPPLTARERGAEFRSSVANYVADPALAAEPARVLAVNQAQFDRGQGAVKGFLGGVFNSDLPTRPTAPPPPPQAATPAVPATTLTNQPAVAVPGFPQGVLRGAQTQAPPTVAPAVTQPRGPVGPPSPAAPAPGLGLPPVPDGQVQVIRGTQVSNDANGLSIPVGLEGQQGRLAAGFKNLGLGGDEIPAALVDQQNADSNTVQAGAQATSAQASLINANAPEAKQIFIPDKDDPTRGTIGMTLIRPDGTVETHNLNIAEIKPLNETQAVGRIKQKNNLGEEVERDVLLDRKTGKIVGDGSPASQQQAGGQQRDLQAPPDVPAEDIPDYNSAHDLAIQAGESEADARAIAAAAVQKKRARAAQQQEQ